ncbi:MAG: PKD domain-containing protein [Anaerolineae bacterium]|jgi:hypothetical protein
MNRKVWLNLIVVCGLLIAPGAAAGSSSALTEEEAVTGASDGGEDVSQKNRSLPDVEAAFDALTHHGEWLGFHNGAGSPVRENTCDLTSPNPDHIQSVVRSPRSGVPHFYVCAAGSYHHQTGVSDANLMVVQMGSRDTWGERIRSNRLLRNHETSCSAPPSPDDVVVASVPFPNYRHPGGMQMVGDILAVPLEQPRDGVNFCDGGAHDGAVCLDRTYCVGGLNHDVPCSDDAGCPGGACETFHLNCSFCVGGDDEGERCLSDAQCAGGTCALCPGGAWVGERYCDGGPDHGDTCKKENDCGTPGVCRNLPGGRIQFYDASTPDQPEPIHALNILAGELPDTTFCNGGLNGGEACVVDADCPGRCQLAPTPCFSDSDCGEGDSCSSGFLTGLDPGECDTRAGAEFAAITQLPDGRFLLMMGMRSERWVGFWKSNKTSFFEEGFEFVFHDRWEITSDWPTLPSGAFQSLSLVNQDDGRLFLIAGRNVNPAAPFVPGHDELVLFEVEGWEDGEKIELTKVRGPRAVSFFNDSSSLPVRVDTISAPLTAPTGVEPRAASSSICPPTFCFPGCTDGCCTPCELTEATNADLQAGGGAYVSPSGELLLYSVAHYHDGPPCGDGDPTVRMIEMRHIHVVRDDSPTYESMADPGGPYVVDEGSSLQLDGTASRPPLAAPWVQLFEDPDFGGQSVMFDYADWDKDDFDDFGKLDGQTGLGLCLNEDASGALAAVTEGGKVVFQEGVIGGRVLDLTVGDFLTGVCYGQVQNGECRGYPGSKVCVWIPFEGWECGPCLLPGDLPDVGVFQDCELAGTGVVLPFPDFTLGGWQYLEKVGVLIYDLGRLLTSVEGCGRAPEVLGDVPPLPAPDVRQFLDPSYYGDFDINDIEDLIDLLDGFPNLVGDLEGALEDMENGINAYTEKLAKYVMYVLESLEGFNNRASSMRWYAPEGVDLILYEKAHYQGQSLTRLGSGAVEEIVDLSGKTLGPSLPAEDRIRSAAFMGLVTSAIDSWAWSITTPLPPPSLFLLDAGSPKPTFDATTGDGPMTAEIRLVIHDSLGGSGTATTAVTINNVAPTVEAGQDQVIYEGDVLRLDPATFSDPGIQDTHTAKIVWTDEGSWESATVTESGGTGTVSGSHRYLVPPGDYTATVCVTDDDGGEGCDSLNVTVVHGFLRFCAYADDGHRGVTVHQDAVAACALAPSGVPGEMRPGGVGSRGGVDVKDRGDIQGILLSLTGKIDVGKDTRVSGSLTAGHDVKVDQRSQIHDSITSGRRVEVMRDAWVSGHIAAADRVKVDPSATVMGTLDEFATVPPIPDITWLQFSFEPGTEKVTVEKDTSLTLDPGAYKDVKVKQGSTLVLSGQDPYSEYVFRKLEIEKDAILQLDLQNGPIVIDVAENLGFKDNVQVQIVSAGHTRDILFRVAGKKVDLGKEGTYLGTYLAPKAKVKLGEDSLLFGALYGKKVDIGKRVGITGMPARDLFASLFVAP